MKPFKMKLKQGNVITLLKDLITLVLQTFENTFCISTNRKYTDIFSIYIIELFYYIIKPFHTTFTSTENIFLGVIEAGKFFTASQRLLQANGSLFQPFSKSMKKCCELLYI